MLSDDIKKLNAKLKAASMGVSIAKKGKGALVLRSTLPPKPGSGHTAPRQYDLSLGIPANPVGLKTAEIEAKRLGAAIASRTFRWEDYLDSSKTGQTVSEWRKRFEQHYFSVRKRTPKSQTTWDTDYNTVLKTMPQDAELTIEILKATILGDPKRGIKGTEPDSRSRKRYCVAVAALAKFAQIEFDPSPYSGEYSPKRVSPRTLPTDEEIVRLRAGFRNDGWRYVYGLMACYGLRNHECFNLDLDSLKKSPGILTVLDGKTGDRRVWPCYPEWWDDWRLWEVELLPVVSGKNNSALGARVTQAFRREGVNGPYNLRHRWAVRNIEMGVPVELSAIQMGHSVKVHTDIYHAFITEETHQRAWDAILGRFDRPRPPTAP